MANYCDYKVIVKGKKNGCYAFFGSMSCYDDKWIVDEDGSDDTYTLHFEGNCKWAVDAYCQPWDGPVPVELPADANEAMMLAENQYWYKTVQMRSAMFQVEVWCNSADVEDYDPAEGPNEIFEHYICGNYAGGVCPDVLRIEGDCWDEDCALDASVFPVVKAIEGTGYEGRAARFETLSVGDLLILKADYNNAYYSPVAIEVFNENGETLGYLADGFGMESLEVIARYIEDITAHVASVTPLSQRSSRAKYPLMDVELTLL